MKNDSKITLCIPEKIKIAFQKYCDDELIDMSVKIRQLILQELRKQESA